MWKWKAKKKSSNPECCFVAITIVLDDLAKLAELLFKIITECASQTFPIEIRSIQMNDKKYSQCCVMQGFVYNAFQWNNVINH